MFEELSAIFIKFEIVFSYIAAASTPIWSSLLTLLGTMIFLSHWLLSHVTIIETMDTSERGMNAVAMTIINPRIELEPSWGSNL